ncbi:MAG: lipid-A-disaccharide synthase [Prevotella sp.]|nr:lipid-A-disaccharide synthase [Prevotella sp.]MBR6494086.1 lipid-A-disaccharide synthase [Prevotella sp.]
MKYYLIVGEASGDLHASHLMRAIQKEDAAAEFRFFGGDLMQAVGGTLVRHYKDLAYMGFIPVLLHLPTIFRNMSFCKRDITAWQPDCVILVDYPGFNLKIAKFLHKEKQRLASQTPLPAGEGQGVGPQIFYYISPKIWAWKEWRIKSIRRYVDQLFSILPFEVDFFEKKHHYPIHYVGNPTADEVRAFLQPTPNPSPREGNQVDSENPSPLPSGGDGGGSPIIALLAGSRRQEIKDNLPAMIEAAEPFADEYQLVVAGAPSIDDDFYAPFIEGKPVTLVKNQTYPLLAQATAALVTSGTATLETALFNVPQVVCYKTPVPRLVRLAFKLFIKCKYISLVNLIADREVVKELFADRFSVENIRNELRRLLPGHDARTTMLFDYRDVEKRLSADITAGTSVEPTTAAETAARLMVKSLRRA